MSTNAFNQIARDENREAEQREIERGEIAAERAASAISMTIDEALDFADQWSHGISVYPGAMGWRVVCMLLAERVRKDCAQIEALKRGEFICTKCGLRKNSERSTSHDF